MDTFQFNDHNVRFIECDDDTYLVTSDAKQAFGLNEGTGLDELSVRLDTLAKSMGRAFQLETCLGIPC